MSNHCHVDVFFSAATRILQVSAAVLLLGSLVFTSKTSLEGSLETHFEFSLQAFYTKEPGIDYDMRAW
jgi:hypothetical protein